MSAPPSTPLILLTNDDGFDAPGLAALAQALQGLGRICVVAPDRERSAAAHALTVAVPLRVWETGPDRYRVDGTPTDCVHLGAFNLTGRRLPDLVVSGINRGLNVGDDVTYSGTVAGALEATLLRIPALAVSAGPDEQARVDYAPAARFARQLAGRVLKEGLPPGVFLNVNVPANTTSRVRITRQGTRTYRAAVVKRLDPAGRPYYWIAPPDAVPSEEPDADHRAVAEGHISVTPLHPNMTHEASLPRLAEWHLDLSPA